MPNHVTMREFQHGKIELVVDNIVTQDTDAIVNSTTEYMSTGTTVLSLPMQF